MPEARAASIKAFLVTKLGDVPFLIGLFALGTAAGSFRITKVLGTVAPGELPVPPAACGALRGQPCRPST